MSDADLLRRAAELMRERAQAATGATHRWDNIPAGVGVSRVFCGQVFVAKTDERIGQEDHNAQHIASWHPAVALAVATLLDSHADVHALRACDERLTVPCPALRVARVYLKEDQ